MTGSISLENFIQGDCIRATLTDVLFVPEVKQNLVSIGKLTHRGLAAEFTNDSLLVRSGSRVVAVGVRQNQRLYKLKCRVVVDNEYAPIQASTAKSIELWHERMGHAHYQAIEEGLRKGSIEGIEVDGVMVRKNRFWENSRVCHFLPQTSGRTSVGI